MAYLLEVGRGLTRVLNALTGGEGDTTFSAQSERLRLAGSSWGAFRVWLVNKLNGDPNHCRDAYVWHLQKGLFDRD